MTFIALIASALSFAVRTSYRTDTGPMGSPLGPARGSAFSNVTVSPLCLFNWVDRS